MDDKVEFNFGNDFAINNDQGLEEEELEDRKRRDVEIHDLLSRAMGNCSLTDDSSVNSSSHTAIETTSDVVPPVQDIEKQYLETNVDDQLKVLYEIRSREVIELNEQLQKVQAELRAQEQTLKVKIALLEHENEGKNISLLEAQNLLVDKNDQINEVNKQLENLKYMVKCLEGNLAEVNEEKEVLRQLNLSLEQQMHLMEKNGFPLMNKSSDRELRESLNNKIMQLEHSLESALKQNEIRVKQHAELVKELKQNIQEKDDSLAEKGFLINKLTENFETAQMQCHELMKTVTDLRETQHKMEVTNKGFTETTPLQEELCKMRENKERSELLEAVQKAMTEEFETKINIITTENKVLNEKLYIQEKHLNDAQQRGEMISIIEKEKEVLQRKLDGLVGKLQNILEENEAYKKRLSKLDTSHSHIDVSLQTSFEPVPNNKSENLKIENKKLFQEIESAHKYIRELEIKFAQLSEENEHLKLTVTLEQERDAQIKDLKEKAVNFEKIIIQKQQNYLKQQSKVSSVATNTEQSDDGNSVLKLKCDTLAYQREADLRSTLQNQLQTKYEMLLSQYKCKECENLKTGIKQIYEERKQDRMEVLKLVDVWQSKIQEIGFTSDEKLSACLALIDKEYGERFKTLAQMLQQQFSKEIKQQEAMLNQCGVQLHSKISDRINKIISKILQTDVQVQQIKKHLKNYNTKYSEK